MAEWSSLPAYLEVKSSFQYGRGIYVKEAISPSFPLLSSQPLAHVVNSECRDNVCQNCLRKSEACLLKCAECKFMYYCNKTCQKEDWQLHKTECAGIKRVRTIVPNAIPSDTMLLITRLVAVRRKSEFMKQQFDNLCKSCESEQSKVDLPHLVIGVSSLLDDTSEAMRDLITDIIAKVDGNAFNVMNGTYEDAVAVAVYGPASLANHSCEPNSLAVFDGKEITLRAMIPLKPGDQVFISYCELMDTKARRQAHLEKAYSFLCSCPRCTIEDSKGSPWSMMYATNGEDVSETSKSKAMDEAFSLLDNDMKGLEKSLDWHGIADRCLKYVAEYSGVLHPLNIALICIRQQLMRAQSHLQKYQEAMETGQFLTKAYRQFLPDWHPVRAIHLVKMGKLNRFLGTHDHLRASITDLEEAQKTLPFMLVGDCSLEMQVSAMLTDSKKTTGGTEV